MLKNKPAFADAPELEELVLRLPAVTPAAAPPSSPSLEVDWPPMAMVAAAERMRTPFLRWAGPFLIAGGGAVDVGGGGPKLDHSGVLAIADQSGLLTAFDLVKGVLVCRSDLDLLASVRLPPPPPGPGIPPLALPLPAIAADRLSMVR